MAIPRPPRELNDNGEGAPHQRLGLGEPVGGLQQLRQVVEADGDVGVVRPKLASSMASARRISGSASAEPVGGLQQSLNNLAVLLRATNRLAEAEARSRLSLQLFVFFSLISALLGSVTREPLHRADARSSHPTSWGRKRHQTSTLAVSAFCSMNTRRGSTLSPISSSKRCWPRRSP